MRSRTDGTTSSSSSQPYAAGPHLLQREPPQDFEAERAALAAMLVQREDIPEVLETVAAEDFHNPGHRIIYEVIFDLFSEGKPVDELTVANRLRAAGKLEEVGGTAYLGELAMMALPRGTVGFHTQAVRAKAILRRRIQAAAALANDPENPALLDDMRLAVEASPNGFCHDGVTVAAMLKTDEEPADFLAGEMFPVGGVTIMAGATGTCKTMLAQTLCGAVTSGQSWLGKFDVKRTGLAIYVDAELGKRLFPRRCRKLAAAGIFSEGAESVEVLYSPFLFTRGTPDVRHLVREKRPRLLVLDSLSRLLGEGLTENDNVQMTQLIADLRDIAEEFQCAIVLIHHWGKFQAGGDPSDIARVRGASSLGQAPDMVLNIRQTGADFLCRQSKSWWGEIQSPFIFALEGGENGGIDLRFAEWAERRLTKKELARDAVLDILAQGDKEHSALLTEVAQDAKAGERTVKDALAMLRQEKLVDSIPTAGGGAIYTLKGNR